MKDVVQKKKENGVSSIFRNALILCLITLIAGVALAFVYALTRDPILKAEYKEEQDACRAVFADADAFVQPEGADLPADDGWCIEKLYFAKKAEKTLGYVMRVRTGAGYGGDIVLVLGVKPDGKISGMRVIDASGESPGLGARCLDSDFSNQFTGMQSPLTYTKGGQSGANAVDAISGATITTSAVTEAVDRALVWIASYRATLPPETDDSTVSEEQTTDMEDTEKTEKEETTAEDTADSETESITTEEVTTGHEDSAE